MITCARISETCGDNVVRIEARASGVASFIFCKASTLTGELFDFEALPADERQAGIVADLHQSTLVQGAIAHAVARGL